MKKYTILFASLLLVSNMVLAQKSTNKKADKFFEMRNYTEAVTLYEAGERTQETLQNLADSYYYSTNLEYAIKTYRELFTTYGDAVDAAYHFRYAHALKGIEEYREADFQMEKYNNQPLTTLAFTEQIEQATPHTFALEEIQSDGGHSDFGLSFYGDNQVAFASTRNTENPTYTWNNQPYLDLYFATVAADGSLENITLFPDVINTASHESNATFGSDGNTMYFNRTNKSRTNIDGVRVANIKIYKAEKVDGAWTNVTEMPFSSNLYSTEHPSLSTDGKTLYFASDMPGTLGSFDIYKVAINDDGTYGEPQNLGAKINTEHREQFPYISTGNVLYFASNGHQGYGGLDIFKSTMEGDTLSTPMNLGNSLNSPLDDFAYSINETTGMGFVSSNRDSQDHLYSVSKVDKPVVPKTPVTESKPETYTDERIKENEQGELQIQLDKIYFDYNSAKILETAAKTLDVLVGIMNKYPSMNVEVSAHTDARGKDAYNLKLSERRAASTLDYLVSKGIAKDRLTSKGYGETKPLNHCVNEGMCSDEEYEENRRCEFTILN